MVKRVTDSAECQTRSPLPPLWYAAHIHWQRQNNRLLESAIAEMEKAADLNRQAVAEQSNQKMFEANLAWSQAMLLKGRFHEFEYSRRESLLVELKAHAIEIIPPEWVDWAKSELTLSGG